MSEDFELKVKWEATEAPFEYDKYSRQYRVTVPGKADIVASAAPAFKGDGALHNPEDFLVAAVSGCHLLTYLALAAKMRITVLGYNDRASANLEKVGKTSKITSMTLRPKVILREENLIEKARQLHEKAHEYCFIAQSVNFPVKLEPEFVLQS